MGAVDRSKGHRIIVTNAEGEPITESEQDYVRRQAAELDAWSIKQGYEANEQRVCLLLGEPEVDHLIARMYNRKATSDGDADKELRSWFILAYSRLWPDVSNQELQRSCHQFALRCFERGKVLQGKS